MTREKYSVYKSAGNNNFYRINIPYFRDICIGGGYENEVYDQKMYIKWVYCSYKY